MPTSDEATPKEIYANNYLPILYIDDVDTHHRSDGVYYLSFTTNLPDLVVEQVRLIVDDEHLHYIIDDLCQTTNYFPKKPKRTSEAERVPSK